MLTYISNLDLPCEIDLTGTSEDDIFQLVKSYMTTKSIVDSKLLAHITAQLILDSVGADSSFIFQQSPFTKDQRLAFIQTESEIFKKWNELIGSSFYYYMTCIEQIEKQFKFKGLYPEVNDPGYLGLNIVNFYSLPGVVEAYFSKPVKTKIYFFKSQFEDYMYKGKNFFYYFHNPNNLLTLIIDQILLGNIDSAAISAFLKVAPVENHQPIN